MEKTLKSSREMAEDILNILTGWEVIDKNDPDYQLFTQDIATYLSKVALLSETMIDRLQAEISLNNHLRTKAPLTFEVISRQIIEAAEKFPALVKHGLMLEQRNKKLLEACQATLEFFRIRGMFTPEELLLKQQSIEGKLMAAIADNSKQNP